MDLEAFFSSAFLSSFRRAAGSPQQHCLLWGSLNDCLFFVIDCIMCILRNIKEFGVFRWNYILFSPDIRWEDRLGFAVFVGGPWAGGSRKLELKGEILSILIYFFVSFWFIWYYFSFAVHLRPIMNRGRQESHAKEAWCGYSRRNTCFIMTGTQ